MGLHRLISSILIFCLLSTIPAFAGPDAKVLFGASRIGSLQKPKAYGAYFRGCAAGLQQLPETGPTWQAMRLSRNRNWGHPELIDFIGDLSTEARKAGWKGLYVGDMSQPRGGPMLTGHTSHQTGLEADIWMYPVKKLDLSHKEREELSAVSMRRARGAYVNKNWSRTHFKILRAAAKDPRVARIFVFPGAKVKMCKQERGDRTWLRKIRPWWGHHYHFHVRLNCPEGSGDCVEQAPPPPGDGCEDAEKWVYDILNPPPPNPNPVKPKPRRELKMSDLPRSCRRVLRSN